MCRHAELSFLVNCIKMAAPVDKTKRPKVGIGVIVTNKEHPGCVLLGKRKGGDSGQGKYGLPGGHLEFGETWVECACRETSEETGQKLKNVEYCGVINAVEVDDDFHYIEIIMRGETCSEPTNLEPDKCDEWLWCDWNDFPSPEKMFLPLRLLREQEHIFSFEAINKTGKN